jgi:glutathione S-transferase
MLKAVMHKVEDAIVGPFMRGDSFSLADVAAAPFFQVS